MNIWIEAIDKNDTKLFENFAKWDSDPEIKPFIIPRQSTKEVPDQTSEDMMQVAKKNTAKTIYAVYHDNLLIGTSSLEVNFPYLKSQNKNVAWISIIIGDKRYWGKGVSKIIMLDLEKSAKDLGCDYIELGVFDFNLRAQKLYQSMGYEILTRIKDFVYYNNGWHDDIRMIKKL